PPAAAASESTSSTRCTSGGLPSSSSSPASALTATTVPIVSKKSASMSVKTSSTALSTPIRANPPNSENCPTSERSGIPATLFGQVGTVSCQPVGLIEPSGLTAGPGCAIASTI